MIDDIKDLFIKGHHRRETYEREKKSEEFQTALLKIKNYLKRYDGSYSTLKVDIGSGTSEKSSILVDELVTHLNAEGVSCTKEYDPGYSVDEDYQPSCYYIVFNF